jgi:hypothetical protein
MNTQNNNTADQNTAGQNDKSAMRQDQPRQGGTQDQQQKQGAQQTSEPGQDSGSNLNRDAKPGQENKPGR